MLYEDMDATRFEQISRELLDLLDQQVVTIVGRSFNELTAEEVQAYQSRSRRIIELRSALSEVLKPK
ncbi:MAG: hypothetical protein WBQ72_15215 [Terriglobales bacterium]|jgi:hypothetical protein